MKRRRKEQTLKEATRMMIMMILLLQFSREGNDTPLQYACLENPMGGGTW